MGRWDDEDDDQDTISATKNIRKKKARKEERSPKRRKLSVQIDIPGRPVHLKQPKLEGQGREISPSKLQQQFGAPSISPCRSINAYERLNKIEEGSYGIVYRGREKQTGDIVAVKELKMGKQLDGFPITAMREIQTLFVAKHPNVVNIREVVVGRRIDQVYIVMDFVEHDLKDLMMDMREPFLQSEIKTLMLQLLSATSLMHEHFIIHRDLKTSNLLMNNRGMLKIADFGLARYTAVPIPSLTPLVVTLWYRAPELLLGAQEYDDSIDMWSIGCIFGELLRKEPLLEGASEIDQLIKIFALRGTPTKQNWPDYHLLPNAHVLDLKPTPNAEAILRIKFPLLTAAGVDLLGNFLSLNPASRVKARKAMEHPYFKEDPRPKDPLLFPSFPSKSNGEKRRKDSPHAPIADHAHSSIFGRMDETGNLNRFQLHI